ncbi:hypothetical protein Scep_003376 [Stephania cephalantha]|uniref:Cationic amino acid transporter C-terminal domain-containing protein n=1 Tax=Stephania cephalantha TaxID=152367 RepID=A0AAP0PUB8_9MAGN
MEKSRESSFWAMSRAAARTAKRVARRAVSVTTPFDELHPVRARSGADMHRTLTWLDLVGLGVGGMVGAGVFVTTGRASRLLAGPAVLLSYAIAGLSALLSAFSYTEFAVDLPVAGGAFSYLRVTFGEFAAFLCGANLVMEYVLSNAAVARSFTAYLGSAVGVLAAQKWRPTISFLPNGFNQIDFIAAVVILSITLLICFSTKESSVMNIVLTATHILFICFIIVMGFWKGDWRNFVEAEDPEKHRSGFFPYGVSGVFNGAAMVYLSYIGYDAVSTMAEEVRNPRRDIPIGVSGSVLLVTVFYCFMSASMSKLVPYDAIDADAPFSAAFREKSDGWRWVSNVIGAGASFGILTSLVVAMLGQARYVCVIGRSGVIPGWFAVVHPKTSTPVNASVFLGLLTATISLFTDLQILLNLVSIGTLFVFYMVANAVIYKRYVSITTTSPWPTLSFLLSFSLTSILFTLLWRYAPSGHPKAFILFVNFVVAIAMVQAFVLLVPQAQKPQLWGVPAMPWVPFASIFLNLFLLGSLDGPSYVRFGVFSGVVVVFYVVYSAVNGGGSMGEEECFVQLDGGTKEKCSSNYIVDGGGGEISLKV